MNRLLFFFSCAYLFNVCQLQAFSKDEFKNFTKAYFNDKESQMLGWSEFIFAIERGYDEIALFYAVSKPPLTYIAEIKPAINKKGPSCPGAKSIHIPSKHQYKNVINTLIRKNNPELLKKMLEIYPGEVNAIDYLIEDEKTEMKEKSLALILALRMESLDFAKMLLDAGADVNLIQENIGVSPKSNLIKSGGTDPLVAAISYYNGNNGNRMEAVSLLLNYGAKPTTKHVYLAQVYELYDVADLLTEIVLNSN